MNLRLCVLFVFLFTFKLKAQTWEKTYPTSVIGLLGDFTFNPSAGGMICTMQNTYPSSNQITCIDSFGDLKWIKKAEIKDSIFWYPNSTCQLSNGNFLVAGDERCIKCTDRKGAIVVLEFQLTNGDTVAINRIKHKDPNLNYTHILLAQGTNNDYFLSFIKKDSSISYFGQQSDTLYRLTIQTQYLYNFSNNHTLNWSSKWTTQGLETTLYSTVISNSYDRLAVDINNLTPTKDGGLLYGKGNTFYYNPASFPGNVYLEKRNSRGDSLWCTNLKSILKNKSSINITQLIVTSDNKYLAVCRVADDSTNKAKVCILKFDTTGTFLDSISIYNEAASIYLSKGCELSGGNFLFPFQTYSLNNSNSEGYILFNKNLQYKSIHLPISMYGTGRHLIANKHNGAFFISAFCDASYSNCMQISCNFDSLFNTYPSSISGNLVLDKNTNCTFDGQDLSLQKRIVKLTDANNKDFYSLSDNQGKYKAKVPFGNYIVTQPLPPNKLLECPITATYNYSITQNGDNHGADFYDTLVPGIRDLQLALFKDNFVPGFDTHLELYYINAGTVTATTSLTFVKDPKLNFINSSPSPASINGDTLIFNVTNFLADSCYYIDIVLNTPSFIAIDTPMKLSAELSWADDRTPADNKCYLYTKVVGAFDPNMKSVNQPEFIDGTSKELIYKIDFQNTGNFPARNVVLLDTIDPNLDLSSFRMLESSHKNVELEIKSDRRLFFNFSGIMLADSFSNEPASHGHVLYLLRMKDNLSMGTTIKNRAHIYFDYNAPIATNEAKNTLKDLSSLPENTSETQFLRISIRPNPSNNFAELNYELKQAENLSLRISDISGHIISNVSGSQNKTKDSFNISAANLSSGIYFCTLSSTKGYSKTIKWVVVK